MPSTLIAFLGARTLVAASPGPSTVLIIKQSLRSRRSGFLTVLGNETGVFVLVAFGVQALRQSRRSTAGRADEGWAGGEKSGWAACRGGLLLNLANPKAAVLAMSFLPLFVPEGAPHLPTTVGLAALRAVYEVGYYGLYVWFVGRMRTVLSRAGVRRRLEQVSGGVLLLLGVRLALEN
ncbi:LysE family translocator [Streptomyces sp. NPDC002817]|uniref:LysE family translocator n=1 Tax=Streptomyces sp. NPDC088357 TaxID=3154655 RepID=UPI003446077A